VLADRERRSRAAIAQSLEQGFAARGVTPPAPVELLALIVHALNDGVTIQRVLSPADSGTDTVVDVVGLLMRSWTALARSSEPPAEPQPGPEPPLAPERRPDDTTRPRTGTPADPSRTPPLENLEKNP
jgi:hypothetical protein